MRPFINWPTSELNTQVNPTTCLGDTGCCIQQVSAPTLVVTCWIHRRASISHSTWTGESWPPHMVQVEGKMDAHWRIQQVTARVRAVTCWIQQPVSPKQVVGFTRAFNSECDQSRKLIVRVGKWAQDFFRVYWDRMQTFCLWKKLNGNVVLE